MNITQIRFSQAVPVPGLSGAHLLASVNNGVQITREGDVVRLTNGAGTIFVPFHQVVFYVADEQPAAKAKRGVK